jgi:transposase-like protein
MNLSTISKLSEDQARDMLESIRWPDGPTCPHCAAKNVTKLGGSKHRAGLYKCNDCGDQFTATVGTIMEDTHLPIRTWMMAFSIICSAKKGISALQLQRHLGLGSYRSAWHLAHRIRHAMSKEPLSGLLKGAVAADETYIGGKPRKLAGIRKKGTSGNLRGRGTKKVPVVALVERDGRVIAKPVERVNSKTLGDFVRTHVDPSSALHTDEWGGYTSVGKEFAGGHHVVNHGKREYARDGVSTNDAEAFFALLKRGIVGSFHNVSKKPDPIDGPLTRAY